jgi:hypothetical protein
MGNNFSKPVRHNVRKQGQKPRQHGTVQKLSREQLIFRIETLREELEESLDLTDHRTNEIQKQISQYNQQLDKFQ